MEFICALNVANPLTLIMDKSSVPCATGYDKKEPNACVYVSGTFSITNTEASNIGKFSRG